jgi:hypothetical protein
LCFFFLHNLSFGSVFRLLCFCLIYIAK